MSAQRTDSSGRFWTMRLFLRIRCSVEQGRAHYMVLDADPVAAAKVCPQAGEAVCGDAGRIHASRVWERRGGSTQDRHT
jgi:hypothetical protein